MSNYGEILGIHKSTQLYVTIRHMAICKWWRCVPTWATTTCHVATWQVVAQNCALLCVPSITPNYLVLKIVQPKYSINYYTPNKS